MLAQHIPILIYTLLPSHWELLRGFTEPFIRGVVVPLMNSCLCSFSCHCEFPYPVAPVLCAGAFSPQTAGNWQYVMILTFRELCIVIYSYNKSQWDALVLKFNFDKELYMFRTDLLSIIRSLNTVHTATGICHSSYVDCLLATVWPSLSKINFRNSVSHWILL